MFDTELTCPYCDEVQDCQDDEFSANCCYTKCDKCEKNFWYSVEVSRNYDSSKDDDDEVDDE